MTASVGDRDCAWRASAAVHFQPPVALERLLQFLQNASAPCALFTLGVTVALRPLKKMPWEVPAPGRWSSSSCTRCWRSRCSSLFGPFEQSWVAYRDVDGGAAAGAQCVRVRAAVRVRWLSRLPARCWSARSFRSAR